MVSLSCSIERALEEVTNKCHIFYDRVTVSIYDYFVFQGITVTHLDRHA